MEWKDGHTHPQPIHFLIKGVRHAIMKNPVHTGISPIYYISKGGLGALPPEAEGILLRKKPTSMNMAALHEISQQMRIGEKKLAPP